MAASASIPPAGGGGAGGRPPSVPTIIAPPSTASRGNVGLEPLNHYDGHRTICTCDDRHQAAMLSGHTWNILNNRKDHEVYYQHARNHHHYVDDQNRNTSHWFERKGRVDLDKDGVIDTADSSKIQEVLVCPATAGRSEAKRRSRQTKQLCQAAAFGSYPEYLARRAHPASAAPPTPERLGALDQTHSFQITTPRFADRSKGTPRVVEKQLWTPRRGEPVFQPEPPAERDMFRSLDQLRAESQMDTVNDSFAEALHSARGSSLAGSGLSAVAGASTVKSTLSAVPKPADQRTFHSSRRVEDTCCQEISSWPTAKDRLKQHDPYYAKPLQQTGQHSVKYDILTNERRQFWY